MRPLLALALVFAGCSKGPTGRFVTGDEGARIHQEGDALFIEVFTFAKSHAKATLNSRVEKHDGVLTADLGLFGKLTLTPTDEGLVVSGGGKRFDFTRVDESTAERPLDSAAATEQLHSSFRSLASVLAEKKKCRWNDLPKLRIDATTALAEAATFSVDSLKHETKGPWFDDYRVSGSIQLPPVSVNGEAPLCAKYATDFLGGRACSQWKTGAATATTKQAQVTYEALVSLPRYERLGKAPVVAWTLLDGALEGDAIVCGLTQHKKLAYAEAPK